jgi:hypothetical protein
VDDYPVPPLLNAGVNNSRVKINVIKDVDNDNDPNITNGDRYWDGLYPGSFNQVSAVDIALHNDGGVLFSTAAPTWDSGFRYFVTIWSEDVLGNVETPTIRRFTVDNLPPSSAVTVPADNASVKTLSTISGTAADTTSGIASVWVTIRDLGANFAAGGGDDLYWSNVSGGWVGTATQVPANLVSSFVTSATWNLTTAGNKLPSSWTSGRVYWVIPQAIDSADNNQVVFSTVTFRVDNVAPVAGIITPANGTGFNTLTSLSGTVNGTDGVSAGLDFSLISSVKLQIIDVTASPRTYWNGAQFNTSVATRTATFVGGSSGTWTYDDATLDTQYTSAHNYLVVAWAADAAGNEQSTYAAGVSSNTFSFDNVAATAAVTYPVDATPYRTFSNFTGTAGDDFSGVNAVQLNINYLSGNATYYFNGVNFSSTSYSVINTSVVVQNNTTVSWSTTTTTLLPQLVSGRVYNVFARALDKASNYGVSSSTTQFLFDTDFATPTFTNPTGAGVYRSPANPLTQVQGSAADWPNHAYAGVLRNEIRLLRTPPGNEYWNGSSWVVNSSTWLAANGTLSWSFNEPSASWQDDTLYRINVRTIDLAGNLSPFTTQNFTYDSSLPTVAIQDPNASYENSLTVVSGTAGDGSNTRKSGLLKAEIAVQLNPAVGGNWWDGNGFNILDSDVNDDGGDTGTIAWISVTTTTDGGQWTLNGSSMPAWTSGQTYNVRVRAQDVALNFTAPVASRTFTYDNVGPISTITFPVLGQFPSVISQIQGTASDATAGIMRVYASIGEVVGATTNYFNGTSFSAATEYFNIASGTTSWTYSPSITYTSGLKYLFRSYAVDKSSNVQSPLNAQLAVYFDNRIPTTTVTSVAQGTYRSELDSIAGSAYDATSGLDSLANDGVQVRVLEYGGSWFGGVTFNQPDGSAAWTRAGGTPTSWTYVDTDLTTALVSGTTYLIQVRARDTATPVNLGPSSNGVNNSFTLGVDSVTVVVDKVAPTSKILFPPMNSSNYYNAISSVVGTSADAISGITAASQVQISMKESSPAGLWWNGVSTFSASSESFYPASSLLAANSTWTLTSLPALRHGYTYLVRVRGTDNVVPSGNQESSVGLSSATFVYDIEYPTATVTSPASGNTISNLTAVAGATSEQFSVSDVRINMKNNSTNLWWNGSAFATADGSQAYYAVTPQSPGVYTTWTWPFSGAALTSGTTYTLQVYGVDVAGNQQPATNSIFIWDKLAPTSNVTSPANGSFIKYGALTSITGTADDLKDIGSVAVHVQRVSDGQYWNGNLNAWEASEQSVGVAATILPSPGDHPRVWQQTVNLPPDAFLTNGEQYDVKSKATDLPGNTEATWSTGIRFRYDTVAPSVAIQFPSNTSQYALIPVLSGTAQDTFNTKQVEIRLKNGANEYWNGSGYVASQNTWVVATGSSASNATVNWSYSGFPA